MADIARTTPPLRATPPDMAKLSAPTSPPTRLTNAAVREAMARFSPATISRVSLPSAISETTSLSANTVHMLLSVRFSRAPRSNSPSSAISTCRARAMASRKRPVPAAHLSFMAKSLTPPRRSRRMALLSCPPISIRMSVSGKRVCMPRAWQVISVTAARRPSTRSRP